MNACRPSNTRFSKTCEKKGPEPSPGCAARHGGGDPRAVVPGSDGVVGQPAPMGRAGDVCDQSAAFLQAGAALPVEAFAPLQHDFAAGIKAGGDLIVARPLRGVQHELSAVNIELRQRTQY